MKNLVVLLLVLLLAGCGTGFCFKVDGEYQGKKGGFEYCYEPSKGILKSASGDALIITEKDLKTIKEENQEVSAKSSRKLIDILLDKFKK